jgi:16S rRNA A1518/A1519 N6-dimethyltransferase RsmA/KsgA/DIM1 with predicted DNA glycosylase/AP lyase activity
MPVSGVNRIYMFEYDKEWIAALETTFEPYKDKVEIINKYVSNKMTTIIFR